MDQSLLAVRRATRVACEGARRTLDPEKSGCQGERRGQSDPSVTSLEERRTRQADSAFFL